MTGIEQRTELMTEHKHEDESAAVSGAEIGSGEGSEGSEGSDEEYSDEDEDSDIDSTDSTHPYVKSLRKLIPLPPHIEVPLEVQIRILSHETSYEYTWERRIGK
jgi:hypothetical protein